MDPLMLLVPPPRWNPYSRKCGTELQLRFPPPRDGPAVSTRLRDYATPKEANTVIALQQARRDLSVRIREASHVLGNGARGCARRQHRDATRRNRQGPSCGRDRKLPVL